MSRPLPPEKKKKVVAIRLYPYTLAVIKQTGKRLQDFIGAAIEHELQREEYDDLMSHESEPK